MSRGYMGRSNGIILHRVVEAVDQLVEEPLASHCISNTVSGACIASRIDPFRFTPADHDSRPRRRPSGLGCVHLGGSGSLTPRSVRPPTGQARPVTVHICGSLLSTGHSPAPG